MLMIKPVSLVMIQIIVLEDTKEYISYAPKEETFAQNRRPFDLMVIKISSFKLLKLVRVINFFCVLGTGESGA